jgi:hypothetical protein
VRLLERGLTNNCMEEFVCGISFVIKRNASRQRLRIRLRFTADLSSFVDASMPMKIPFWVSVLGAPCTHRTSMCFPRQTLPCRIRRSQTLRPERRSSCTAKV